MVENIRFIGSAQVTLKSALTAITEKWEASYSLSVLYIVILTLLQRKQ